MYIRVKKLMMKWNPVRVTLNTKLSNLDLQKKFYGYPPPKARRLGAFLKNQYKRSVVEVKTNEQTNFCHQCHKIVISDICNRFPFLQITLDRANCMLLSFLSQIQSVPKDYSITYIMLYFDSREQNLA